MSDEFDRFVADVATSCPSVIPATIDAELMTVLRDFLQNTSAWKQDFEMPVVRDRTCYLITPPAGTQIYLLFNIFKASDPDRRPVAPGGWRMTRPGNIEFAAAPQAEELWVARVSLFPIAACKCYSELTVPATILTEYYDTLLQGVLGRLQMQLMKSYTNPQMAVVHQRLYREGRAIARSEIARGHIWGTQQWRFPAATTARTHQRGA